MKTAFATGFQSYAQHVKQYCSYYREEGHWLISGVLPKTKYSIVVSVVTKHATEALAIVLPVVQKHGVPFRIIKSEFYHYQMNGGHFGENEIGKFIELYPVDYNHAFELAHELEPSLRAFEGPVLRAYKQLNEALFVSPLIDIPAPARYRFKSKRLLKGKYFVVGTVHKAPKGDIRIAFARNGFKFSTVIVKQARKYMFDDDSGRDVRDRLTWEYRVLWNLHNHIRVPYPIDFFEDSEGTNLVLEFIAGKNFYQHVTRVYKNQHLQWNTLPRLDQQELLIYFLRAAELVRRMHQLGFIHRDLNHKNFIIESIDSVALIDLELSFDINMQLPDPAFIIGMPGFVSPEQKRFAVPTAAEDVYSLGALLFYMLTTHHPANLDNGSIGKAENVMAKVGIPTDLISLVMRCMHPDAALRPNMQTIISAIDSAFDKL